MSYLPIFPNGSVSDGVFSIHSAIDLTRKVVFDLSAIGPGITRTIIIPNNNIDLTNVGTVTSVALTVPSFLSIAGSPVTTTGTLAVTLASQAANTVFAAPNGSSGAPTFRLLVAADLPALAYVTNIATGTGLTGGPISGSGTISLATIATGTILANISGGTAAPIANTLTAIIDNATSTTQGSILYRNATTWVALAPGTAGQVLNTGGAGANPSWATPAAGTVTSVAMTVPGFLSVAGSPITSSGTLAVTLATQAANLVFAGPASAGPTAPTFRSLVMADFPTATAVTISSNANAIGSSASLAKADHTHQLTAVAAAQFQIPKYDGTDWQAVYAEDLIIPGHVFYLMEDFCTVQSTTIGAQLSNNAFMGINTWLQKSAGAASGVTMSTTRVDVNHPGVIDIIAAGGAGNYCDVLLPGIIMVGGGVLTFEALIYIGTLATVANDYTIRLGLGDTQTAADNANGIYFEYTRGTSVNWLRKTAKTSTVTSTASTTAVATGWTKLKFVVNAAASSVEYFVNGTTIGTVTTNIPTSVIVGLFLQQTRVAGTPVQFSCDYVNINQRFTTIR